MLQFYVRHGTILEKIHETISYKQSKWLEKNLSFDTQNRNKAKNEFEGDFYKLLNNAFMEKQWTFTKSFEIRNYFKKRI